MRRHLRTLSTLLIVVGVLLLAEGAVTVLWQEPVSGIYSRIEQGGSTAASPTIEGETSAIVERTRDHAPADPQRKLRLRGAGARPARRRRRLDRPRGRRDHRRIDRMDLTTVFVAGTDGGDLRLGPGHYPSTPLPGVRGTVAIAGHRTTYGAPFRQLDKLRDGDAIQLRMPYGNFTYKVERTRIVPPTATWVTERASEDRLVLSACHPLYSAAKRIVVFARLVSARRPRAAPPPRSLIPRSGPERTPSTVGAPAPMPLVTRCSQRPPHPHRPRVRRASRAPRARAAGLPMADTRTAQVPGEAHDRAERSGYHVDATAVAAAIVDRLAAGGALPALFGAEPREERAPMSGAAFCPRLSRARSHARSRRRAARCARGDRPALRPPRRSRRGPRRPPRARWPPAR